MGPEIATATRLETGPESPVPDSRERLLPGAIARLAAAIGAEPSPEELLRLAVREMGGLTGSSRCSLYLREPDSAVFRGFVSHPDRALDATIRRLTCGVEADGFTREILRTLAPAVVTDSARDPRVIRSAMRAFRIRSMMGVPMVQRGLVSGIFFVDTRDEVREFSAADQASAAAFANLVAAAVDQCEGMEQLRSRYDSLGRRHQALRQTLAVDRRFARILADGGGPAAIAATLAGLTGKPCAICDQALAPLAISDRGSRGGSAAALAAAIRSPAAVEQVAVLDSAEPATVAVAGSGQAQMLVTPVFSAGSRVANIVILDPEGKPGAGDSLAGRRAAAFVALELASGRREARSGGEAREMLAAQLLRGSLGKAELQQHADSLFLRADGPRVVCLIGDRAGGAVSRGPAEALATIEDVAAVGDEALATATEHGLGLILGLPDDVPAETAVNRLRPELEAACLALDPKGRLVAGISWPHQGLAGLPAAYDEARQVAACVRAFTGPGAPPVQSAAELGPGRALLASVDPGEAARFAEGVLGTLLDEEAPSELLTTLACLFAEGRSVRRTAAGLDVHPNTVRYRLARIEALTGLDVAASSDDQLSVQIALTILRLQGQVSTVRRPDPTGPLSAGTKATGQSHRGDAAHG